jgi:hypothetical protein
VAPGGGRTRPTSSRRPSRWVPSLLLAALLSVSGAALAAAGEPAGGAPEPVAPGAPEPGAPEPGAPEPGAPEPGAPESGAPDLGGAEAVAAAAATARIEHLERRVVELLGELHDARVERDRLARLLERLTSQVDGLEADRLLLTELRKEVPTARAEAERYLERLRRLALIADPMRLAPLIRRMMDAAPEFLDWRDGDFANPEARSRAFAESGAHGFPTAFTTFRNAVLLSVSNRIEGLLVLIE